MNIEPIIRKVGDGGRVSADEALALYLHAPTHVLGRLADDIRRRKHPGSTVTYIIDRNVNYTNVCVAKCNFCAFYRDVGSSQGYVLGFDEIFRKIDETIEVGGVQLLLQGGHNPDLPLTWYEDLFRAIKSRYPDFKLHALSPPEVIHLSRLSQLDVPEVIDRLIAAGLDSIPGGGAEILVDRVRRLLHCYGKATADEWLDVMRHAHRRGLRTTATMMYGTVETPEERIEHMLRLRALQDETSGFTAFITWSFQPEHTELGGTEATGVDYLRTLALARIVLDNFDNLQASWVTQGGKVGQLSLAYGANDMGSVMIEENVVRAAGAAYCMDEIEIVRNVEDAGFIAKRRNMHYDVLGDPMFRMRQVPRMLSLATARADGSAGEAPDAMPYPARSREGKHRRSMRYVTSLIANPISHPMPYYRVAWLLPISQPPIRDAWLRTDRGRIVAFGHSRPGDFTAADEIDLGDVAVLPGLVNAHTHLELSWMRGRIPETADFGEWIRTVIELKNDAAGHGARVASAIDEAVRELRGFGTALVGDVSNTLASSRALREQELAGIVFHELLGFRSEDASALMQEAAARVSRESVPGLLRHTIAPHAPYSVSPALFGLIRDALLQHPSAKTTVHLGESAAEIEFLEHGSGPCRASLERMGKWDASWVPPRSGPVEYLDRMGFLDDRVLVVHGVQFAPPELAAPCGCRRHARDLPARKRSHRRRYSADR